MHKESQSQGSQVLNGRVGRGVSDSEGPFLTLCPANHAPFLPCHPSSEHPQTACSSTMLLASVYHPRCC